MKSEFQQSDLGRNVFKEGITITAVFLVTVGGLIAAFAHAI